MKRDRSHWWKGHFERDGLAGYGLAAKSEAEARGVLRLLRLGEGARVLDLCCGAGRHAVLLARAGLRVTGLDFSAGLLARAREAAREAFSSRAVPGPFRGPGAARRTPPAGPRRENRARDRRSGERPPAGAASPPQLKFARGDMRRLRYRSRFDAVVNLFTSFGYFPDEADDLRTLRGVRRALRPGGVFLIDLLNKEWLMRHFAPAFRQRETGAPDVTYLNRLSFDPATGRLENRRAVIGPRGRRRETFLSFRVYTLTELRRLLSEAGLGFERAYGGFDGRSYGIDTRRMIVLARRLRG